MVSQEKRNCRFLHDKHSYRPRQTICAEDCKLNYISFFSFRISLAPTPRHQFQPPQTRPLHALFFFHHVSRPPNGNVHPLSHTSRFSHVTSPASRGQPRWSSRGGWRVQLGSYSTHPANFTNRTFWTVQILTNFINYQKPRCAAAGKHYRKFLKFFCQALIITSLHLNWQILIFTNLTHCISKISDVIRTI